MSSGLSICKGRPSDIRIPKEEAVYDLLDSLGIEYDRADHQRAAAIEACHEVEKALGVKICKNLFLCNRQKTDFYILLMPGEKPFKTKELSSQLGVARLSFGEECFMEELLNLTPGSVSVLGLMNDKDNRVRLLIDKDILSEEYFGCHPCINTSSLKIKTSDVIEKIIPATGHSITYVELGSAE